MSSNAIHSLAQIKLATGMPVIAISIGGLNRRARKCDLPHAGLPVDPANFMINFCNDPHIRAAGHSHRNGAGGVRGG